MKKALSFISASLTALACIPFTASADNEGSEKLPFELTAPENVSLTFLEGEDSPSTCEVHYSQNDSMSEWSTRKSDEHDAVMAELQEMGYDDVWIQPQIDWSLDSQDDWKCNDYWLTDGYDENMVQHLGDWAYISASYSNETAMSDWIFRGMGNIEDTEDTVWYGAEGKPGWKDVLREGQYSIIRTVDSTIPWIDFTQHTAYVRVRWMVTVRPNDGGEDKKICSEWSDTAAVGKDAEVIKPLLPGDIAPPVISGLKYLDEEFNGYPVIGYRLDVTPELAKQAAQVNGTSGTMRIYTEAKVQGREEWVELQGDCDIKAGDVRIYLQALAEAEKSVENGTPIEVRTRIYCSQKGQDEFYSDYSDVLTFGSLDMEATTGESIDTIGAVDTTTASVTTTAEKKDKCGLCGFCPRPLGICLFIILAIILVIIGGIIAAVLIMKKKDKNAAPAPEKTAEKSETAASEPEKNGDDGNNEKNA